MESTHRFLVSYISCSSHPSVKCIIYIYIHTYLYRIYSCLLPLGTSVSFSGDCMTMDRVQASPAVDASKHLVVLSIECLKGSSKAGEWTDEMLQTGDIVEELRIGGSVLIKAPFKNGKSGVKKILQHSYKSKDTSIVVRVRRGSGDHAELHACIVPYDSFGKKQYILRAVEDPNYAVGFCDRTESDCLQLIGRRRGKMLTALSETPLQDGYVSYKWESKLSELLQVPSSSCFLSILFFPKACDGGVATRYNDLEDTLARANAWLNASQCAGVPIVFMNIQTESLLTKISGETASTTVNAGSLSDLSNLATTSLYGFEDYHGVDIGVVRAVRLWYAPHGGEFPIEIRLMEGDTKLGFAISRTEEGFIHISSVIDGDANAPSTRSGLLDLHREARRTNRLLVVSRVSGQKVLPWIVSSTGAVRCYDTVSLSQKLSLHRHAKMPILIHVILWDKPVSPPRRDDRSNFRAAQIPMPSPIEFAPQPSERQVQPTLPLGMSEDDIVINTRAEKDTSGDSSFRFREYAVSNNWV